MSIRWLLALALLAGACDKASEAKQKDQDTELAAAEEKVGQVTVDELASLLDAGRAKAFDANGEATRERMGVVPGATLLSNYREYDLGVLPADKATKVVFYCANEKCGASHKAAARAVLAGWTDVAVLPAGIAGWVGAGKPVDQPKG